VLWRCNRFSHTYSVSNPGELMMDQLEGISQLAYWADAAFYAAMVGIVITIVDRHLTFQGGSASISTILRTLHTLITGFVIYAVHQYHESAHRFDCLQRPYMYDLEGSWPSDRVSTFYWEVYVPDVNPVISSVVLHVLAVRCVMQWLTSKKH
jgi:hypothetical protein